jgi:hypothetical protein
MRLGATVESITSKDTARLMRLGRSLAGSLAKFTASRRASSLVSSFAADRGRARRHLIFTFIAQTSAMTKTVTAEVQVQNAEQRLFAARQALGHLVEMFNDGRWRLYYRTDQSFAAAVREQREAVDHWTNVVSGNSSGTPPR